MTTAEIHINRIDEALSAMEAGTAGNDLHYAMLKALADAVRHLLQQAQPTLGSPALARAGQ